jgi:xanthine dehydrogenase/oxidase
MTEPQQPASDVRFVLNGVPVRLRRPDPSLLLVDYLRSAGVGLTGTKLVCGEGGCGSCTVTIAHLDEATGSVVERAANACLRPVCTLDGTRVTTVEGLGSVRRGPNPIQRRIVEFNGSQCGFCTPGWVMAMYGLLRENAAPSAQDVEDQFAGNLCRCTGMRPILSAMQSFVGDAGACREAAGEPLSPTDFAPARRLSFSAGGYQYHRPLDLEDVLDLLARHRTAGESVKLMNGNTSVAIYKRDVEDPSVLIDVSRVAELSRLGFADDGATLLIGAGVTLSTLRHFLATALPSLDPSHAAGLRALAAHLQRVAGQQVRSVASVAGNLMLALEHREKGDPFPSDLMTVFLCLRAEITIRVPNSDAPQTYPLLEFPDPASFGLGFVITGIRVPPTGATTQVATYKVARRTQNAHPLINAGFSCDVGADTVVTRALLVVGGLARFAVALSRAEHALVGRPWTAETLAAAEAAAVEDVRELLAPMPGDGVSAAYRADLVTSLLRKYWVEVALRIAPAEVPPQDASAGEPYVRPISHGEHGFVQAPYFEGESLKTRTSAHSLRPGTPSYAAARQAAYAQATARGLAPAAAPRPVPAGGKSTTAPRVFEHVIAINTPDAEPGEPPAAGAPRAAAMPTPRAAAMPTPRAAAAPAPPPPTSADSRSTGEVKYAQDAPLPPGVLEAAFVYSTAANARFAYGELSEADVARVLRARHEGVVGYVSAGDIPNRAGSDTYDDTNPAQYDPVFASGRVTAYGQPIGLVLADTARAARAAAAEVQGLISYDTAGLTPAFTIEAAKALPHDAGLMQRSGALSSIERAGSDISWLAAPGPEPGMTYVTGTQRTGAQAHFYFETQTAVAIPTGEGGILLYSSSQHLAGVQWAAAQALGLPLTRVEVRASRLGGGYGGKEVRPPYFATAAAVAAWAVGRPVRLALDRNTDMLMVGKRHPYEGTFHALADPNGRIVKFRVDFASDGGYSYDCSSPVMDLVLLSADNAYNIPTFQANGKVYRTNRASNTAFRSFGVIQCTLIVEEAIERVAHALGRPAEEVRRVNFYRDATTDSYDVTPYGQALKYARLNQVWDDLLAKADVTSREAAIEAFNQANRWRKRGLAVIPIKYGISYTYLPMNQATGEVIVYSDGSVLVHHGGIEMGQGIDEKIRRIVADALDIPAARVDVAPPDTASVANASSTGASTGTDLQGGAVLAAAKRLRKRLEAFCAANPTAVKNSNWHTDWSGAWNAVIKAAYTARIDLASQASYASPHLGALDAAGQLPAGKQMFYYFTYSAGASEVEIDVLTGESTILRSDLIYDAGQTVDGDIDFGQVEGGFVQGIGNVTTEQLYYDDDGRLISYGTWNYKPPCSKTIPVDLRIWLLEYVRTNLATKTPIERYGIVSSKAVGEPPLVLAASVFFALKRAIAAARSDAGLPVPFDLEAPATVERIRQACTTAS